MFVTGSIRQRKKTNGTRYWQLTAELGKDPVSQKRLRKYRSVEGTKKEAERALRAFITEIEKGMYVTNTKITVHEWVDTWLEVYIIPNVSPTTLSLSAGVVFSTDGVSGVVLPQAANEQTITAAKIIAKIFFIKNTS